MPYIDPDEQQQKVYVRFPGDPHPQDERHNDFSRREFPKPEILGSLDSAGLYGATVPETEEEALMAAPGEYLDPAEDDDVLEDYAETIRKAYVSALPNLTPAQAEAWSIEREGLSQRDSALKLGIGRGRVFKRLDGARRKLTKILDWVIAPELKAKYRKPKPPAQARPIAWTLLSQQIGAELAKSDNDDQARWRLARLLTKAIDIGMSPTDLAKRTGILPNVLAQLVSDFRNG